MGHECDVRAFDGGDGGAADERILISVATGDAPLRRNKTVESELESIRALAAGLQNSGQVVWIRGSRVSPILPVGCRCERQIAADIPLHSEFVIGEFFRFDLLCNGRQLRELVAGARQVSDT